ncbi:ATP-binding protein [Mycobacterium sp. 1081908.1]|uniref:ATP-binding protein n=1 Tax=Mycobacterium sp. 1081908.1 TaxID=1834066 RepID=UPI0018D292B2|nr:ATP-binding protein [Mycobacterium sp. 1081908.1]
MLGEIEMAEWQCLAELIDNAFDDFTEISRMHSSWPGGFKISVALPAAGAPLDGAEVAIIDTGGGMSFERLQHAVRAGWSGNDRFDKLGLFGMGFNVSTARLGTVTRVLTTRPGDPEWIGVEIDFDSIGDDWQAADIREPKADLSEHGTRVEIRRLKHDRAIWLSKNAENLRRILSRTYSWILDNRPFELWIQGTRVKPRRPCAWSDERSVTYGSGATAEEVPAIIHIDEKYEDADACGLCGHWQRVGKDECEQCRSPELSTRERRIHGWLGVQRHLHRRDYGIDFLRNGRKILQYDKRLFDWVDINDPLAGTVTEYPIELVNQGGRLIGEIHLDHVPVTYQKDAFEYGDRSWRSAMEYLRGSGPLQQKLAAKHGYEDNTSPLGRLFKAYRRNVPGLRCLIPGDGKGPIHEETRNWANKFWAGDPDYQSDLRWWEAVLSHEERKKKLEQDEAEDGGPTSADEAEVLAALGVGEGQATPGPDDTGSLGENTSQGGPDTDPPRIETQYERIERYKSESTLLPELSRDFGLPDLGFISVECRELSAGPLQDAEGRETPVWISLGAGMNATAFIDPSHKLFSKFGADPADIILVEIAAWLKVRAESPIPHSQILGDLKQLCLPDSALDFGIITNEAREMFADIRQRMANCIAEDPERAIALLNPDEITEVQNAIVNSGTDLSQDFGSNPDFLLFVPPLFLVRLLESWPEVFMDGRLFMGPYADLAAPSTQRLSLAKVQGLLSDIATLLTLAKSPGSTQLRRTRLSMELLSDQISAEW